MEAREQDIRRGDRWLGMKIDPRLKRRVAARAHREYRTISDLTRAALTAYLETPVRVERKP